MNTLRVLAVSIVMLVASFGAKAEWQFLHAHDGDTPTLVNEDGRKIKIRVRYIDTPEANQEGCLGAKTLTGQILSKKRVLVQGYKPSRDRLQATLKADNVDLGRQLVKEGWAWVDPRYTKDAELFALQDAAKKERRGLWAYQNPIPPWKWRKSFGWNGKCDM